MKKLITIVLALTLVVSAFVLAGCNKTAEKSKETIRILMPDNAGFPFKKVWLLMQEYAEKFPQLNIEVLNVPSSDYGQKYQMMLNSGDTPDIITHIWGNQMSEYASAGSLASIDDYMDKLPNFQKRIADWNLEAEINGWREIDGKLYVMPGMSKDLQQGINLAIRKDLLNKYNIPIPETYEDFYQALRVMKQNDPSILGLTERDKLGGPLFSVISRSFDTNGGYSIGNGAAYRENENKWVFEPVSEEFREMLRYLNKLYKEGLLDEESFSQDEALFNNKIKNTGKAVAAMIWNGEQESVNIELAKNGVPDAEFDVIFPLAGPKGTRYTRSANRLTGGFAIPISATKRNCFGDILAFTDFMYSTEGTMLNTFGKEGVTFDIVDDKLVMKPEIKTAINPNGTLDLAKEFGVTVAAFRVCPNTDYPSVFSSPKLDAFNKELAARNFIPLDEPSLKFKEEEKDREKILAADLKSYYGSMMIKFILGDADLDRDWDGYVSELEAKGYKDLMKLVDTAWTRQTNR